MKSHRFLLLLTMICCLSIAQGQRWPVPEIDIYGNRRPIADGDMTPSANDHTDFGNVVTGSSLTRTYTIRNIGTGKLYLIGPSPVEIVGTHATDFTVVLQPSSVVLPGGQTSFQIKFSPARNGVRSGMVRIVHSDSNENPYNFAIRGKCTNAGSLDFAFDGDGKVITDIGNGHTHDYGKAITIQSDGKIVVAGSTSHDGSYDFAIVRYNSDGSLDTSFNGTGKVITSIGPDNDHALSMAIHPNGKIIAAGISSNGSNLDFAIIRYHSDGSIDTGFGDSGIVTTDIGAFDDYCYSIVIQRDDKIVAAGYTSNKADFHDFAVIRYNSDGTLDDEFGNGGIVITDVSSFDDYGYSAKIQPDGKIVVAGTSPNGSNYDFAVVRYNQDGTMDTSFSSDGKVLTAIGEIDDYGRSVAIQSDGKIVVAGYSFNGKDYDFAVTRYNPNGTLDISFGSNGKLTTQIGPNDDKGYCVNIQMDGKIIVAGNSLYTNTEMSLVRYNANGDLDPTFGADGKVVTPIGPSYDFASDAKIQSDGKIVLTGYAENGTGSYDFAVVRYLGDDNRELLVTPHENFLELSWESQPNDQAIEYNLWSSDSESGPYDRINAYPIPEEKASGEKHRYAFLDSRHRSEKPRYYKLEAILIGRESRLYPPVKGQ